MNSYSQNMNLAALPMIGSILEAIQFMKQASIEASSSPRTVRDYSFGSLLFQCPVRPFFTSKLLLSRKILGNGS